MCKKTIAFLVFALSTSLFSSGFNNISVLDVNELLKNYFNYKEKQDSLLNPFDDDCFNDCEDFYDEEHPAHSIYRNIWTRERLNPYGVSVEQLTDSIHISCRNFVVPTNGRITSHFGFRRHRPHFGTDIKLNTGDSVRVAFPGKVRIVDYERKGFGRYVVIRHTNGLETLYAHLSKTLVSHNQDLQAGETIGLGGSTGRSTGPHLHFEVRYLGNPINPCDIIDFEKGEVKEPSYMITKNGSFSYSHALKSIRSAQYAVVRKGDTLSTIAARHRTSTANICRLNKISTKKIIRPGQKLRVR